MLQLGRACQSGASRSSGLQENDSGGVDFIIRSVGFAESAAVAQEPDILSDESEAEDNGCAIGHDDNPPPVPSVSESEAFHMFFANASELGKVRFNTVSKVTPPAQYLQRSRMVHFKKSARQSKAFVLRAAQLDPTVYVRAIESEVALVHCDVCYSGVSQAHRVRLQTDVEWYQEALCA